MDPIVSSYWDETLGVEEGKLPKVPAVPSEPIRTIPLGQSHSSFPAEKHIRKRMNMDPISKEYWTIQLGSSTREQKIGPLDEYSEEGYQRTEVTTKSTVIGEREEMYEKMAALRMSSREIIHPVEFQEPDEGTPAAEALLANAAVKVSIVSKGLRKLQAQKFKRKALKKLNIVKQLRKTQGGRQFSKNFKGKVIDGVHELYTLTAGMMLGMRCSVERNHPGFQLQLTIEDFSHVEKITFPAAGSATTPPHSLVHTFKFKSYSLKVFRRIRDFFGIDNTEYMTSVCGNYNFLEFISNSKSGQFFFYSHDGKYMIKTQTKEENKFMKQILPHYYQFVTENPHTLLCRIVGMHRVKMYHLRRQVRFVIMTSVFDTPEKIHIVYDLKGSLIGRQASEKERTGGGVLKDLDLVNDHKKLHLGSKKPAFMAQLKRDAMFLAQLNIMDYSLLVGIHHRDKRKGTTGTSPTAGRGGVRMNSGCLGQMDGQESEVLLGPSGQHSNTPFRRQHRLSYVQPQSSPSSSGNAGGSSTNLIMNNTNNNNNITNSNNNNNITNSNNNSGKDGSPSSSSRNIAPKLPAGKISPKGSQKGSPQVIERKRLSSNAHIAPSSSPLLPSQVNNLPPPPPQSRGAEKRGSLEGSSMGIGVMSVRTKSGQLQFEGSGQMIERSLLQQQQRDSIISTNSWNPNDERGGGGGVEGDRERRASLDALEEEDSDIDDDEEYDYDQAEEEIEEHFDDGDSDDDNGMRIIMENGHSATMVSSSYTSSYSKGMGSSGGAVSRAPLGTITVPISPSIIVPSSSPMSIRQSNNTPQRIEREDAGKGWIGLEGSRLSRMVRRVDDDDNVFAWWTEKVTFGPGASQHRPWTRRKDGGINSRLPDTDERGREIYFCGVIDILQQYNLRKRSETFFKSFTNDSKLISSVDAFTYATRFVKFIGDNSS